MRLPPQDHMVQNKHRIGIFHHNPGMHLCNSLYKGTRYALHAGSTATLPPPNSRPSQPSLDINSPKPFSKPLGERLVLWLLHSFTLLFSLSLQRQTARLIYLNSAALALSLALACAAGRSLALEFSYIITPAQLEFRPGVPCRSCGPYHSPGVLSATSRRGSE